MTLVVEVTVSGSAAIRERWQEIESAIGSSFAGAKFFGSFRTGRPIEHTREIVFGSQSENFCHIIAVGEIDQLYGAFFYLPIRRPPGQYDWEPGWFFTSEKLPVRHRVEIATAIVSTAHNHLVTLGFKRIVAAMGTIGGARFLAKKFGYRHEPSADDHNRWVKELLVSLPP